MYVCVDLILPSSARNSTYITGFWAVGQKDEALDLTTVVLQLKFEKQQDMLLQLAVKIRTTQPQCSKVDPPILTAH